jgi:hypothetical protein
MKWYRAIALGALIASATVFAIGGSAATGDVPAPVNLEVVGVTEDSITIAWGPSPPGPFTFLGEPKKNTVLVGWGASDDSRSAVTYTVVKDGTQVATGVTQPQYLFSGINQKVKSFRICVTATNAKGQNSTQSCGSMTRIQ